jgi:hypothetical protein
VNTVVAERNTMFLIGVSRLIVVVFTLNKAEHFTGRYSCVSVARRS